MRLTTNHPIDAISNEIMDFLARRAGVKGDEIEILNEPISNILGRGDVIDLEEELALMFEDDFDLSGIKLVAIPEEDVFQALGNILKPNN